MNIFSSSDLSQKESVILLIIFQWTSELNICHVNLIICGSKKFSFKKTLQSLNFFLIKQWCIINVMTLTLKTFWAIQKSLTLISIATFATFGKSPAWQYQRLKLPSKLTCHEILQSFATKSRAWQHQSLKLSSRWCIST